MSEEFDRAYWEEHHRNHTAVHTAPPHPHLVAEAGRLPPGAALDAGCGEGAEALWLASRGWRVTAVDISDTVLRRARKRAERLGAEVTSRIDWVRADLTAGTPRAEHFDLVTTHYAHPRTSHQALFRSLASAVAPGGTLIIVGHHPSVPQDTGPGGPKPEAHITAERVTACLERDRWHVTVAESRTRSVTGHDGRAVTLHDTVLTARRRA